MSVTWKICFRENSALLKSRPLQLYSLSAKKERIFHSGNIFLPFMQKKKTQIKHLFLVYPLINQQTYERTIETENQSTDRPSPLVTWGASSHGCSTTRARFPAHARTTRHSSTRCSGDWSCFGMLMSCWHGRQRWGIQVTTPILPASSDGSALIFVILPSKVSSLTHLCDITWFKHRLLTTAGQTHLKTQQPTIKRRR